MTDQSTEALRIEAMRLALCQKMDEAEEKAIKSLAGYKFYMFGYWAAAWVKYNQLAKEMGVIEKNRPSPFAEFVNVAKARTETAARKVILREMLESKKGHGAYIEIKGDPLCEREGNVYGLMSKLNVTCGHESVDSANRTKRKLERHSGKDTVRVVEGPCPAYVADLAARGDQTDD